MFFVLSFKLYGQTNLDYYLNKAYERNIDIKSLDYQITQSDIQLKLSEAENSGFQIYLSSNYLFAPFFNNGSKIITANPSDQAIGYDAGVTNGGLYSAQLNLEKNLLTGFANNVSKEAYSIQNSTLAYNKSVQIRDLTKQIIDIYLQAYYSFKLYKNISDLLVTINKQLLVLESQVLKGTTSKTDYLLLEIEKINQQNVKNRYYLDYRTQLLTLNDLCNINDTTAVTLDSISIGNKNIYPSYNLLQKFSLDSANYINQQNVFELKYKPQVSFFFNTGLNAVELNNIQRKFGMSAGINFQLPLFDGNQKELTKQATQISLNAIAAQKDNFVKRTNTQKQIALGKINALKEEIESYNFQINNYKLIIQSSYNQLSNGSSTMTDYLITLKNYIIILQESINKDLEFQLELNNYFYWN